MNKYIKLIEQFESKEGKIYWINKLKASNSIKGKLIIHFKLGG